MGDPQVLERLYRTILARAKERPEGSYVVRLLDGGLDAIAAKIREEADELCEAAPAGDRDHTVHEAADLLFHTWVLLGALGIEPELVLAELARRARP